MERLHPGVYIEEIPSGVRPIEGVSTSTAAFLGQAEWGAVAHPLLVTSFTDFERHFGGFLLPSYLAHSALNFFNNGGRRLYVVRVARENCAPARIVGGIPNRQGEATLFVEASSPGVWGNILEVEVEDGTEDPANEFRLVVRHVLRSGQTQTEVFDNLRMRPGVDTFVGTVVSARSRLVKVEVTGRISEAKGTSISGLEPATELEIEDPSFEIRINNDFVQEVALSGELTTGDLIAKAITERVTDLSPRRPSVSKKAYEDFEAAFSDGVYVLTSGVGGGDSSVVITADGSGAAELLRLGTSNGGTETTGAAILRPAANTYFLQEGSDGKDSDGKENGTPAPNDYVRTFPALDSVTDVNMIAVPGIASVVSDGSSYCERRKDCFFVGEMPLDHDTREEAVAYVNGPSLTVKSSYAALYFPWATAIDPAGLDPEPIELPPSGFVCGMYARIDSTRGVWKAPAGTEANVAGAVGLVASIGDREQDTLNPIGVNVIRFFPASGIVIWGARTLATRSDPEYRYVPVRRFAIFLEQSIYNGIQWAVFEPNDEDLWASLRLNIGAFMMNLFRAGAFQGDTPSKAFFVKCDAETNPQDQIDAGIVTVLVGFAPLKPAEFVVIRISQKTAEGA